MNKLYILVLFFVGIANGQLLAQAPLNDECEGAIVIDDPTSYCSGFGAFTNEGATPSLYGSPSCFTNVSHDVWFTFTAVASDVVISVNGASSFSPGGTLIGPEVTLYAGQCGGTISELECQADNATDFIDLSQSGISVGTNLLVRVEGLGDFTGTFELCIQNFNPPVDPSSDCTDAAILCDKSSFTVDRLVGAGNDDTEFDEATCFNNGDPSLEEEFNSVWFKWTCDQPGSLVFSLTPIRPVADLDFVLFELPGGIDDCANKQIIRCEAAGEQQALYPSPCHGPTGLSFDANDVNENAGCDQGQDNFLAPVEMVAGRSYALGINNFGPGTEGFSIEFGGTGTFLGPKPAFTTTPDTIQCLSSVTFTDESTFANGSIVGWSWNFGEGADPVNADGPGSHTVTYNSFGTKFITLTVESDEGCIITETVPFEVERCCLDALDDLGIELVASEDPLCNGFETGFFQVTGTDGTPYYQYSIDGGDSYQTAPTFQELGADTYDVLVVDRLGCEEALTVNISEPPPIVVDAGPDVTVNLGETTNLNAYYTPENFGDSIFWNPDSLLSCNNCLDPTALPAGTTTYEIAVQDEDGCLATDSITVYVTELRPLYIPNAFSPDFDGVNDFFNIYTGPAVDIVEQMDIYDRWGELVYRGENIPPNSPTAGWNGTFRGKVMRPAVFAYVIKVRFIDGVVLQYEGDVTLLY